MNDIGIRELKAHASELVRRVAEDQATYTITRRGRAIGVLAPADFLTSAAERGGDEAWDRLLVLVDRLGSKGGRRKSALKELAAMRR